MFLFFIICVSTKLVAQEPLPAIGEWREHLPYNSAVDIAAGDGKIFCATPYSLFSVTQPGQMIERYSRTTGLSETGIAAICYDELNHKLLIAYQNSNIDIIYRNDIYNVPDIKRDNIAGDKTIYNIYPLGKDYFLSTGLGIVVINGDKYEVRDSWFIGAGGNPVKTSGFTSDVTYYFAATAEGLKRAAINSSNPANPANWQLLSGSNGLSAGLCSNVVNLQNRIIVQKNDSLFVQNGNNWNLFYADGWPFVSINVSGNKLLVCERQTNGIARVVILNSDATVNTSLGNSAAISFPRKGLLYQNDSWIADQFAGLSHFISATSFQSFIPSSPQGIASGQILINNNSTHVASGAVNSAWNYQYNGDGIFVLANSEWNNINRYKYPSIDTLLDYLSLAIDSRSGDLWAGSYGGGLLHLKPGPSFEIFKQNFLGPTVGDPTSYRVAGLCWDAENNLWISNFGSTQPLRVRKADGNWKNFSLPFSLFQNALSQIIIDDNNFKWIVSPLGNGLVCYDHGSSIDITNDDRWRRLGTGDGNGHLPSNDVLCLAKDKNGFIWAGTTDGVGVFQCPGQTFSASTCDAIWPIVPNGSFAGYLFKGQEVRSIAVDGADRKWVATRNGVFLVSSEGDKIIYGFTEDNSPLLSSDVKQVAVDGKSGEVFFATAKGLCSFRSTATDGGTTNENVLVFPNPVPPGYSGTIAVRGLVENAMVKITELDGKLVFQSRALGGQMVWDGRNYKGQKVTSGAYLVLVADDQRKEHTAAKIFFIR